MTPAERDRALRSLYAERRTLLVAKRQPGKPFNARLLKHLERQIDIHEMAEYEPERRRHQALMRKIKALLRRVSARERSP